MSPLMYAAREGRSQVIERLVSAGANVDKQDTRGWTVYIILFDTFVLFITFNQ